MLMLEFGWSTKDVINLWCCHNRCQDMDQPSKPVIRNFFSTTPPLSNFPLVHAPWF